MTRVKICGITRLEDALAAAELGAELLGFNFYAGSKRFIETKACKRITADLDRRGIDILKVMRTAPPVLLVDAHQVGAYGGTGQTADWETAAMLARKYPLLLAGGLTPQNVDRAVRQVQPWGVDVASGVESAPGVKDRGKMAAFIQAVKGEDMEETEC
ncbi:MAG: phosphoribosylanthranilate isomerase [Anaerolineales bacterium]